MSTVADRGPASAARAVAGLDELLGGRTRRLAVLLLACVLGLQTADLATIGAVGGQLENALAIDHAQLGLLATASALVGAVATLPFGALADRVRRVTVLAVAVGAAGAVMVASALAPSFGFLLVTRLGLGCLTGAAGPLVASLVGDYFPAQERARYWSYIITGELVGTAFGFVVSGTVAGILSWRWAFAVLAIPSVLLAWGLARLLREPRRGGEGLRGGGGAGLSLLAAARYVLRIPTNVRLITASALGYFFFAGVQTFGVIFMRHQFGLSQASATLLLATLGAGALIGVLLGGRIADHRLRSGHVRARITVGWAAFAVASALFAPAFAIVLPLVVSMPLFVTGAGALGAASPPLDAARLDIVPPRLWGRAEAIRTVLRMLAVAAAPILFGLVAGLWASTSDGLRWTFLIMLVPLALSALVLKSAGPTYQHDVAAAEAKAEPAPEADR